MGVVEILFMFPSVTGGLFFVGLTFFDVCGSRNTNAITIKSCDYSYCNIETIQPSIPVPGASTWYTRCAMHRILQTFLNRRPARARWYYVFHCLRINMYVIHRCSKIINIIISNLSNDRSKASSKTIPPHSEIYSFLLQLTVSSPVLKVIQ